MHKITSASNEIVNLLPHSCQLRVSNFGDLAAFKAIFSHVFTAHAQKQLYLWASGQNLCIRIRFLDPDFYTGNKILTIWRCLLSVLWRCWLGGRKGIRPAKKLSGGDRGVLEWLPVWGEMQICTWSSWCHCYSLSLASAKSTLVLPFWYWLTWAVPDKGPLNGCCNCWGCFRLIFAFDMMNVLHTCTSGLLDLLT